MAIATSYWYCHACSQGNIYGHWQLLVAIVIAMAVAMAIAMGTGEFYWRLLLLLLLLLPPDGPNL